MSDYTTAPENRLQCRHILTSGHRCGSPCLRGENFCYYHHNTRKPAPKQGAVNLRPKLEIPLPEDRSAVQHAIGQVLQRIAEGKINSRRAGLLLYGLQIASHNLPKATYLPPNDTVDVTYDLGEGLLLAPESELPLPKRSLQQIVDERRAQEELDYQASRYAQVHP